MTVECSTFGVSFLYFPYFLPFLLILFLTKVSCLYKCLWRAGACWRWLEVTGNGDSSELSLVAHRAQRGMLWQDAEGDPLGSVWERSVSPPRVHKHKNGFVRGMVNAWEPRTKMTEFRCQRSRGTLGNATCSTPGLSVSLLTPARPSAQ